MELKNKRVLVVGLGKSGLAAARFLRARGAWVTVSDARPATLIAELPQLVAEGIAVEAGSHGLLTFRRQDLIVVSPGVPMDVPELKTVRAMGVRVIGELELGAQFLRGQVLAITGSNGKTTTTTLVGEILKAAGLPMLVGGNIGKPVVEMVAESVALEGNADSSAALRNDKDAALRNEKDAVLRNDKGETQIPFGNDKPESDDSHKAAIEKAAIEKAATETQIPIGKDEQKNEIVWSVLEVSSFQLETIETFKPRIAVVLNITPDHLDRHGSFQNYAAAKARITENQTAEDFLVLNAEDVEAQKIAAKAGAKSVAAGAGAPQIFWFSPSRRVKQGAFVHGDGIYFCAKEGLQPEPVMPVAEIPLEGAHNVENVCAAVCAAKLAGVETAAIREAVQAFKAVEHRLEFVRELAGVRYFNDSKATNVDATTKAIEAFAGGIHLILGGKDKDSDYTPLAPLLRARVKTVITIGTAAEKIEHALAATVKMVRAETMDRAVAVAHEAAVAGDVVLLAPACASFDQFENYGQRGRVFKDLVMALK
jgi:UDP-N-acetylmuramoylalanine--D-glutamate ligase